ncbi:hypothetical protein [Rhodococcus sp. LB1]|uniref:hypothetical protein n=1 Tax=Rhodococcus sp. LB1 TaxID=1807499 RepID=UPI000B2592C1|nr:hypothetical protein [Rhodococcus sp. LB1]
MSIANRHRNLSTGRNGVAAGTAEDQMHRYRQQRRRNDVQRRRRQNAAAPTEAELILHLASTWAPYGGVPEEETFQRFGLSRPQFANLLWRTVAAAGCGPEVVTTLAAVYPPHRPTPQAGRSESTGPVQVPSDDRHPMRRRV